MVASACPEERFVAGAVPVWLGAPRKDESLPRGRALGSSCSPGEQEGRKVLCEAQLCWSGAQHSTLPPARHSPGDGPHLPRKYYCMFNSWHCKNIAVNAQPASLEKSPCLSLLMIDCCKDTEMISAACQKKP